MIGDFHIPVHINPFLASDKEDLAVIQRRLDCDVLITGGTHEFKAYKHDGKFFVDLDPLLVQVFPRWEALMSPS